MIKVYYDGKCNLCHREIEYYKSIADKNLFSWLDIATNPDHLNSIGITQKDALLYLHVKDEENNLHIGIDAFILIWKNLRFWKIISYFVSLPIIKQLSILLYKKFAKYRFSRLPHCQIITK